MKFIIEHLEPRVFKWCKLEYFHISSFVGKENLWISNVKNSKSLAGRAKLFKESVSKFDLKNVCVLDPAAEKELSFDDAKKFDFFVFGGILGDYPPRKRTKEELTKFLPFAEKRHLGGEQMATDNAVFVVKEILSGKKLSDLKFQDGLEIDIKEGESVQLPYRYVLINGRPLVCDALVEMLKTQKGF